MRTYMANAAAPSPLAGQLDSADPSRTDTGSSQRRIWAMVQATQDRLARSVGAPVAGPASPSSLQLSLQSEKLKVAQAAYLTALQNGKVDDDVVGYIAAINGKIGGREVYASAELFRKMWPKLLAAGVTEAIGDKDAPRAHPPLADQGPNPNAFLITACVLPHGTATVRSMPKRDKPMARGYTEIIWQSEPA